MESYYSEVYNNIREFESKINALTYLHYNKQNEAIKESTLLDELPLRGYPVIVKDTLKTKDMPTTAGSKQFEHYIPDTDADVINNIRKQGGLIFAKSNTPEFALDYQTYNDLHGITSNPYDYDRTPGGSSGGSAAALAAGYCDYAVGSDLGGSLRQPASYCGVVSLRPSFGTIPDKGQLPEVGSNHIATLGPMGSSVEATSRLFAAMQDKRYEGLSTLEPDKLNFLVAPSLEEIPIQHSITEAILDFSSTMQKQSMTTEQVTSFTNFDVVKSVYMALSREFIGEENNEPIDNYLNERLDLRETLVDLLGNNSALLLPVTSIQPYYHNLSHDNFVIQDQKVNYWIANGGYCQLASVTGNPVITLPIGTIDGLPVGIQIIGTMGSDLDLLNIAYTLEQLIVGSNPVKISSIW